MARTYLHSRGCVPLIALQLSHRRPTITRTLDGGCDGDRRELHLQLIERQYRAIDDDAGRLTKVMAMGSQWHHMLR